MIDINFFRKVLPGILVLSILANFCFMMAFYQSNRYDKYKSVLLVSTYINHLRTFTEYVDSLSDKPDDAQTLKVLTNQSHEIITVLDGGNYYSFKHMSKLYTSLNSVTAQVNGVAYSCQAGMNSKEQIEDIKYINDNFKDIVHYFDEIRSDIFSNKTANDYLIKKQVEISNKVNQKVELINNRLSKYTNQ